MNSKERSYLRSESQNFEVVVYIGKEGITDSVVKSAEQAIAAREMIKCCVQQNCAFSAREASDMLCAELGAEGVSCTGRRFVIYRHSDKNLFQF